VLLEQLSSHFVALLFSRLDGLDKLTRVIPPATFFTATEVAGHVIDVEVDRTLQRVLNGVLGIADGEPKSVKLVGATANVATLGMDKEFTEGFELVAGDFDVHLEFLKDLVTENIELLKKFRITEYEPLTITGLKPILSDPSYEVPPTFPILTVEAIPAETCSP
jgi:hypothetical protein